MSAAQNVRRELTQFIVENFLFGTPPNFSSDDSFLENGILDSTAVLELIFFVESRYGIKVEDIELIPENLDSINGLVEFVQRKTLAAPGVTQQTR